MNTQYMKVNPNELVIDLPVDEAKVIELMESIKAYGLLQSPNIWLSGLRIIDGFHRVVACQRLGLTEIDCIVTDCDEEAFWDARIIAAKPHSTVSDERLAIWIVDSWKASKWYKKADLERMKKELDSLIYVPNIPGDSPDKIAVAQALWDENAKDDVKEWFAQKARKWGVDQSVVFRALGFYVLADPRSIFHPAQGAIIAGLKKEINLSVIEATALGFQSKSNWADIQENKEIAKQWILDARKGNKSGLRDYADNKRREDADVFRKNADEQREKANERYQEWAKTPAGKAEIRAKELELADRQIGNIFIYLENLNIMGLPEALRRLTSLIGVIENKMEEAFPDHVKKTRVNPIIAENIELRRQAEEQKRKIESLERALNSKQGSTKMLPKTQAFSSIEIEAMA